MPVPGLYGRKPPKRAPALELSRYLTGAVPAHPAFADYLFRLTGWQMLGNDQYGDCVSPDIRVLTADLRWVPAGDLLPGEHLLAFDEESPASVRQDGKRGGRRYRRAAVERVDRVLRPCYDLEFDDGTKVRCSSGHKWLTGIASGSAAVRWVETKDLKLGKVRASHVVKPLDIWETDSSREAGYLAGAFDGEGNLDQCRDTRPTLSGLGGSNRVAFAQVDNAMLAETERCLKVLGFDYGHTTQQPGPAQALTPAGAHRKELHRLTVGTRPEMLRFLGSVRPLRLLPLLDLDVLGRLNVGRTVRLVRKEFVGEKEVVMLDTSARTYFAEGLASHNCVAVTWSNTRRLVTAVLATENYPPLAEVIAFYKTQNPGFPQQDDGMDIQTALEYLVKTGGPDGVKAAGFAKVDYTNPDEVKAAIAIFGSVWTGINVQAAQESQFNAGQPWNWVPGSPAEGGHSIVVGGYGEPRTGQLAGDEDFITWSQETSFTDSFWSNGVEEAWVVIWPEHLGSAEFLAGVDLAAFAAGYTAITGQPFPAPVPVPPVPDTNPADVALAHSVAVWANKHHVLPADQPVAGALRAWLLAKGFPA